MRRCPVEMRSNRRVQRPPFTEIFEIKSEFERLDITGSVRIETTKTEGLH